MLAIRVTVDRTININVIDIISKLKTAFPCLAINGNTYNLKRQQLRNSMNALAAAGTPIKNPEIHYRIISRNEEEQGESYNVTLPFSSNSGSSDGITLTGDVSGFIIALTSVDIVSKDLIDRLHSIFSSLSLGAVALYSRPAS